MTFSNPIVAGEELVRSAIRSPDFAAGVAGWIIRRDGSAEFNDVTARGSLLAGTPGGTRIEITGTPPSITLFDGSTIVGQLIATGNQFDIGLRLAVTGDSDARWFVRPDGAMFWGPGNVGADTNLYRSAPNTLKTDDNLDVAGRINSEWTVFKTAEPQNNTTTLQDDPQLQISVPAAGKWRFEGAIWFRTTAAADFKGTFVGTGGVNSADIRFSATDSTQMFFGAQVLNVAQANTFQRIHIRGYFTASAAGSIILQWAQQTADPGPTAVLIGSHLQAEHLA